MANCLLDIDMVLALSPGPFAEMLDGFPELDGWVYDISDQVIPPGGPRDVVSDLTSLGLQSSFPRWYGGEFILGNKRFFAMLHEECQRLLPLYLGRFSCLHHVGDEAIVSVAIDRIMKELKVGDAGPCQLVLRYWSGRTKHVQKSQRVLNNTLFWHLPDSKHFLQSFSKHGNVDRLYRAVAVRSFLAAVKRIGLRMYAQRPDLKKAHK
jgi:hypothetical protein